MSSNREQTWQNWGSSKSIYLGKSSFVTGYLSVCSIEDWNLCFFVERLTSLPDWLCYVDFRLPLASREIWGISASWSSELLEYAEGEAISALKQQGRRWTTEDERNRDWKETQQYCVEYENLCVEKGIGFLGVVRRVFNLKRLTRIPFMMKDFDMYPFMKTYNRLF